EPAEVDGVVDVAVGVHFAPLDRNRETDRKDVAHAGLPSRLEARNSPSVLRQNWIRPQKCSVNCSTSCAVKSAATLAHTPSLAVGVPHHSHTTSSRGGRRSAQNSTKRSLSKRWCARRAQAARRSSTGAPVSAISKNGSQSRFLRM